MGLTNCSILAGNTIAVSGGTARPLTVSGESVPNGIKLRDLSVSDLRIQPTLVFSTTMPTVDSSGKYTGRFKSKAVYVEPFVQADGTMSFDVIRIERSVSPERPAAQVAAFNNVGAQLLFDADFTAFWASGSVA